MYNINKYFLIGLRGNQILNDALAGWRAENPSYEKIFFMKRIFSSSIISENYYI